MTVEVAESTYLEWALECASGEEEERECLLRDLPEAIIDVHAHANGAAAVRQLDVTALGQVRTSFPSWSLADSAAVKTLLFGDRVVRTLWFAQPWHGIDHQVANAYLRAHVDPEDRVALCGIADDAGYTREEIATGAYTALKMYPYQTDPPRFDVDEFFPRGIVSEAARVSLPLIVHLGRPLASSYSEVVALARRHPDLPIVLAHLGRQLRADDAGSRAVRAIADLPNVAMDCSMATDVEVYRLVFDVLGPERVLYGSDQPMNLLRFIPVEDPLLGRRLVSDRKYHWLSDELFERYRAQARDARLAHWQVLSALDEGITSVFGSEASEVRQRVFHDNALEVYPAFAPGAT